MPSAKANYYESLISTSPALQAFLNLIGRAEGADYNTGFGNRHFTSLAWHPYQPRAFVIRDPVSGLTSTTSAAGKYQFQRGTWDTLAKQLQLPDFSADSQDIAAVALIDQHGALNDVLLGNTSTAISKLRKTWQSFITRPLSNLLGKYGNEKKKILAKQAPMETKAP